ncbi:hypothetical protein RvY_15713 [Ramazzottius varieornatus]|uniref:Uncharacterized protein n=1 Tax=Ramazzottius varieornatus TaxID=947166 RepID=A0A1D1VZ09_RAMVA|nr:hypothetical protein RvY_15713 [Ramazzottius varieornatus]
MTPKRFTVVDDPKPDTVRRRLKRAAEKGLRDTERVRSQRATPDLEVIPLEESVDEAVIPADQPALDPTHRHDVEVFLEDEFLMDRGTIPKKDFVNYINTAMTNLMTGQQRKAYPELPEDRRNLLVQHLENCSEAEAMALDEDDIPPLGGEECENDELRPLMKKTKKFLIKAEAGRSGSRTKAIAFVRTYSKKAAWKDKDWYLKISMRNAEPETSTD